MKLTSFSCRLLAGVPLLLGAVLAVGGCSDVITYSKESRAKGLDLYDQGAYADAAGAFRNAIRQNPADYRSHYYLGACYAQDKNYHEAIQQYQTCLAIMPSSLEGASDRPFRMKTLDGLAAAFAATGDRPVESPEAAAGADSSEQFFLLAKVNRNLGDADAALEAYHQAQLLNPDDFYVIKEYGLYLLKLNQVQQADPELRHAYTLNDKDDEVNAALRQIGVVPGPGLKPEADMQQPIIPEGPIPSVDLSKIHLQNPFRTDASADSASTSAGTDVTPSPKD
jgi:tetratricopeptide (TPR) repeat protein